MCEEGHTESLKERFRPFVLSHLLEVGVTVSFGKLETLHIPALMLTVSLWLQEDVAGEIWTL